MGDPTLDLYFIALIPPPTLQDEVRQLKEEMRERFQAKHALRSPAHITLQMPFRWDGSTEDHLIAGLHTFATGQTPFPIELSGFDAFPPRVIYVRIARHEAIGRLYRQLQDFLRTQLAFSSEALSARFHPHMTIANRDLQAELFPAAWAAFADRAFAGSFIARSLYLLKHTGTHWEIYREFPFAGKLWMEIRSDA